MNEEMAKAVWILKVGKETETLKLWELKRAANNSFQHESDNYKQKLVYDLLEAVKNNDQNRFFYLLLKAINKPKEDFKELLTELEKNYNILPEKAFINFAYSIIIGIMKTYQSKAVGGEENVSE